MARLSSVFLIVMCCARSPRPPSLLSSFAQSSLSLFAMPKVYSRNEVGAIVHAVSNRALSDHTAKNFYGNANYAKTFLQGIVMNVFDRHAPGGMYAVLKLTVRLQDALQRTCARSQIQEGCCPLTALHPRAGSGR